MTHCGPMHDSEGEFKPSQPSDRVCPKCDGVMRVAAWESNDGAYEDYKYTCTVCGHGYWIDGVDS